eukprot:2653261-Prymnesium_polylepis.1
MRVHPHLRAALLRRALKAAPANGANSSTDGAQADATSAELVARVDALLLGAVAGGPRADAMSWRALELYLLLLGAPPHSDSHIGGRPAALEEQRAMLVADASVLWGHQRAAPGLGVERPSACLLGLAALHGASTLLKGCAAPEKWT